jgi:hypothetical protein
MSETTVWRGGLVAFVAVVAVLGSIPVGVVGVAGPTGTADVTGDRTSATESVAAAAAAPSVETFEDGKLRDWDDVDAAGLSTEDPDAGTYSLPVTDRDDDRGATGNEVVRAVESASGDRLAASVRTDDVTRETVGADGGTNDTDADALPVPFSEPFDGGLDGWTVDTRFRTGDRFGTPTPGDGGWSDAHGGSVRLHPDGGPSNVGVARNTTGLREGTRVVAHYESDSFEGQPGTARLLLYPPGEYNENEIQIDSDSGRGENNGTLVGTVPRDLPPGTQVRVTAGVWPGEYTLYVTNVSAGSDGSTSASSLSFERAAAGATKPADPWFVFRDNGVHEISTLHPTDGNQSLHLSGEDNLNEVAVAVPVNLTGVAEVRTDVYVERADSGFGDLALHVDAVSENKVLPVNGRTDDSTGQFRDRSGDLSPFEGEHDLVFRARGANEGFFDHVRFYDAVGNPVPAEEVVVSEDGGDSDDGGDGTGNATDATVAWSLPLSTPTTYVEAADVDGDGADEVGVSDAGDEIYGGEGPSAYGLAADGGWTWRRNSPAGVQLKSTGDVTGDGAGELVYGAKVEGRWVRPYSDEGEYVWNRSLDGLGNWVDQTATTDYDGDGADEVVAVSVNQGVMTLWQDDGTPVWELSDPANVEALRDTADVTGDATPELLLNGPPDESSHRVHVISRDGQRNFTEVWRYEAPEGESVGAGAFADVDDDGEREVFVATTDGVVRARELSGAFAFDADVGMPDRDGDRAFDATGDGTADYVAWNGSRLVVMDPVTLDQGSVTVDAPVRWATAFAPGRVLVSTEGGIRVVDVAPDSMALTVSAGVPGNGTLDDATAGDVDGDGDREVVAGYPDRVAVYDVPAPDDGGDDDGGADDGGDGDDSSSRDVALVSEGATATASTWGTYNGWESRPEGAIDGVHDNHEAAWGGTQGAGDWLRVDLGRTYDLSTVRVDNGHHSLQYTLRTSADGETWHTVAEGYPSDGDTFVPDDQNNASFDLDGRTVRYVAVNVSATSAPASHIWQAIIEEVEAIPVDGSGDDGTDDGDGDGGTGDGDEARATNTTVDVVVDGMPEGFRSYNVTLTTDTGRVTDVSQDLVASREFQTVGDGVGPSVTARGLDLSESVGTFEDTRTLFTATVSANVSAENLSVTVHSLVNDQGLELSPDRVSVRVDRSLFEEPLPGAAGEGPPTDPDGDAKYEDIDGDGEADFDDAIALGFANTAGLSDDQIAGLDFDGDGDVDFDDAVALAFQV